MAGLRVEVEKVNRITWFMEPFHVSGGNVTVFLRPLISRKLRARGARSNARRAQGGNADRLDPRLIAPRRGGRRLAAPYDVGSIGVQNAGRRHAGSPPAAAAQYNTEVQRHRD